MKNFLIGFFPGFFQETLVKWRQLSSDISGNNGKMTSSLHLHEFIFDYVVISRTFTFTE